MSIIKIRSTWNSTCLKFVTASQNDVNNVFKNLCNNKTSLLGGISFERFILNRFALYGNDYTNN